MNARVGSWIRNAVAVSAALVVSVLASGDTLAGHGYGHGKHYAHGNGHVRHGCGAVAVAPVRWRPVVIPRVIAVARPSPYRTYYDRRVWYAPHRHAHVVYRFPVAASVGVVLRPYTYCGAHLFVAPPPAPYYADWSEVADDYYDDDDRVAGHVEVGGPT